MNTNVHRSRMKWRSKETSLLLKHSSLSPPPPPNPFLPYVFCIFGLCAADLCCQFSSLWHCRTNEVVQISTATTSRYFNHRSLIIILTNDGWIRFLLLLLSTGHFNFFGEGLEGGFVTGCDVCVTKYLGSDCVTPNPVGQTNCPNKGVVWASAPVKSSGGNLTPNGPLADLTSRNNIETLLDWKSDGH